MSWVAAAFSRSFERSGRLEMGLKLLGSSGSRPGFLRRGVMAAILRGLGTVPEVREELMMSVMSGAREVEQVLTRTEGRGSRGEVDLPPPVPPALQPPPPVHPHLDICMLWVRGEGRERERERERERKETSLVKKLKSAPSGHNTGPM